MADEGEAGVYRNSGDATEVPDQEGDDDALMCPVVQGAQGKPQWRLALDKAIRSNKSQVWSKWFQLATVRVDGSPANRTVVFRGFVDGSDALYIVTDSRSNKVGEIARNPCAEIAWYFTISREQFRIRCQLRVVGPVYTAGETEKTSETSSPDLARLRVAAWQGMSCAARNGFAWPQPGDSPPAPAETFANAFASPAVPPDTFSIVVMEPSHVDHLILKGTPQRRTLYTKSEVDSSWISTPCNP